MKTTYLIATIIFALATFTSCGDDDDKNNEANTLGVGAQCTQDEECDVENGQSCILDFKGGYCGVAGCVADDECPEGSRCVEHEDGNNYCFLTCVEKIDCNINRDEDSEANCSSSIDYAQEPQDGKACVPPQISAI